MPHARKTEEAFAASAFPRVFADVTHPARPTYRHAVADRLVTEHQYLCHRGARKFLRSGLERCDLEQTAAIGLIKASRRYDPASTTPFEAYAWILIVGELMHHVRDYERPVRVPRRLQALERPFTRAHDALLSRLGREPSDAELAGELAVTARTIADLRRAQHAAVPLELAGLEPALGASDALSLEDRLIVDSAFGALDNVGRRVIVGVYLLGLTQLELGRRLGLSPKRVSRAHHAALANMQRSWAS